MPRRAPTGCTTRRRVASPATTTPGSTPRCSRRSRRANGGHQVSYGADVYTEHLQDVFRAHFGERAAAYPVFNGTGANVVALQAITQRWQAVVCAESAHINVDECGAPEKVGGIKLLTVPAPLGKLTPESIDLQARGFDDEHRAQPARRLDHPEHRARHRSTRSAEIAAIVEHAHGNGMAVHLDGARIANAAAALDVPLRAFTTDLGVDILSFGGTKNGLMIGEAVVVLNPDAVQGARARLPAQVLDAARVQDALRLGAVRGAARGRPVAAQRPPRQRHGRSGSRRRSGGPRRHGAASGRGQRGLRRAAGRGHGAAAEALSLLRLGRGRPARCGG